MVWKSSREATCVKIEYETSSHFKTLVVANFYPAGNVDGEFPYNVFPAKDLVEDYPFQPQRPSRPGYDRPTRPNQDRPTRPDYDRPTRPDYDRPTRPDHDRPTRPDYDRPTRPDYDRPTRPDYDRPTRPDYDRPIRPTRPDYDRPPYNRPQTEYPTHPISYYLGGADMQNFQYEPVETVLVLQ